MITQTRSKRKSTSGKYQKMRKKIKREIGKDFLPIHIDERKRKMIRGFGGTLKNRLLKTNIANVIDKKTGKSKHVKIISVKESSANPHFVRMNIITKGAVVETDMGLAKVTSRPGQDGVVNAVLVGE